MKWNEDRSERCDRLNPWLNHGSLSTENPGGNDRAVRLPDKEDNSDPSMNACSLDNLQRSVVLVGIMGVGKSAIGRRLAMRLGLPFVDADHEIEAAAGCTIDDIFSRFGEAEFRKGEARVIKRLIDSGQIVMATGGGAYMNDKTRTVIKARAISIWLRADLDTLVRRVRRRTDRPLLKQGDPRQTLKRLMAERDPTYAMADIVVDSTEGPHDLVVDAIVEELKRHPSSAPDMAYSETRQ